MMKTIKRRTVGLLAALMLFLAADAILFYMAGMPRMEAAVGQKEWAGLDLLKKYHENQDMVGWLQVDGTNINYPVMRGRKYLSRNFRGDYDAAGSLFVEESWSGEDMCTLIYGHNMWMYGTMLNPLHQFEQDKFFQRNRTIRFYALLDGGQTAEKRTYEILCCSKASVDEWNYASCQYICSVDGLDAFAAECRDRAVQKRDPAGDSEGMIVLSTCSYHVGEGRGRLLVTGELTSTKIQTRIDINSAQQRTKTDCYRFP